MTQQYLRQCSITVGDATGQALDFADFRVTFEVRRGDQQTPNSADVRIYNLSAQTANAIQAEFTQLTIMAGYPGNMGLIFTGTVKQVRKGRIDQKDSYLDITAADGDEAYNYAVSSFTLAAGSTKRDSVEALLQTMLQSSIKQGYIPSSIQNSTNGSVRGRVFYGLTRDELRDFANANGVMWSIQDGQLTLIPKTDFVPGEVPIISPTTGLIGVPEQTQNGVEIRVLLNPLLKIGQKIQIQSKDINQLRYGLDMPSQGTNPTLAKSIKLNADGYYYVMQANHSGDTRGNNWYTDLTCLAIDATPAPSAYDEFGSSIFPEGPIARN